MGDSYWKYRFFSSLASSSSPSFPNVQQSTKHTQREERLLIFDPIKCNYFLGGGKKLYTGIWDSYIGKTTWLGPWTCTIPITDKQDGRVTRDVHFFRSADFSHFPSSSSSSSFLESFDLNNPPDEIKQKTKNVNENKNKNKKMELMDERVAKREKVSTQDHFQHLREPETWLLDASPFTNEW